MPIEDFSGETYVAFTDISGFKLMMKDETKAIRAIDNFYQVGFDCLEEEPDVNGLFVSDSGVLFSRSDSTREGLKALLRVIEMINRKLLSEDIMLTTSIAFGQFSYRQKFEFVGIEKNSIYGHAYVKAFLDNENGKPKIKPGECRIVTQGLRFQDIEGLERVERIRKHFHFYWMVNYSEEIERFQSRFTDSYQLQFKGMLDALKWRGQRI